MKRILNLVKHPLFSGSAIMVVGSNSVNFLNYLYHLLMGKLLGPIGYGELVALISVIGLLGIIPGSISLAITRYVSSAKNTKETNNLISWLRIKIFQTALILFAIIIILAPGISSFLHINKQIYLILIAISYLFSLPSGINRAILQGLLKFKEMVVSVLFENFIKLSMSVLLIYLGFYLFGAMLGLIVATVVGWYLTHYYLRTHFMSRVQKPQKMKDMIIFTFPVMIQAIATTSLYTSDLILVKHFFSSHDAGIYAALSTLGKVIFFGVGPIGAVMFPLVAQRVAKGEDYKKIFCYSFMATIALSLIVLVLYWLFPNPVIRLLYTSAYLEASNLLVWFGLFISLFSLSSLLISFNLSLGKTKVVLYPLIAAFSQILLIWYNHKNLYTVILISIIVTALLLVSLLIYSTYAKQQRLRNKINIADSSGL